VRQMRSRAVWPAEPWEGPLLFVLLGRGQEAGYRGSKIRPHVQRCAELARRGYQAELLEPTDPDFLAKLVGLKDRGPCVVLANRHHSDLRLNGYGTFENRNLFDLLGLPAVFEIKDHPFSSYMRDRVRFGPASGLYLSIDSGFLLEASALNPAIVRTGSIDNYVTYGDCRSPVDRERPIDVLIPMSFGDGIDRISSLRARLQNNPALKRLADDIEQSLDQSREVSSAALLDALTRRHFAKGLAETGAIDANLFDAVVTIFGILDQHHRDERRIRVIGRLLEDVGDLNVVLVGKPPPEMGISDRVRQVGFLTYDALGSLMAEARITLNLNPTYVDAIHERLINAMASGSAVMSDLNRGLRERFVPEGSLIELDESRSLRQIVGDLHPDDVAATAERGRQRIEREFSLEAHVQSLIDRAEEAFAGGPAA